MQSQRVTVEPMNLCTKCTCAHLWVGRKCSWCTACCYSTVAAGQGSFIIIINISITREERAKHR